MLLALDYDKTYLADTAFWDAVIEHASQRGHQTIFTSIRELTPDHGPAFSHPTVQHMVCTAGKAKHGAVYGAGHCPSVWIDTTPQSIVNDSAACDTVCVSGRQVLALDYDDTYTRDPALWDQVIALARQHGHSVLCATMRYPHETAPVHDQLDGKVTTIVATGRKAKLLALSALGLTPTVWIDDQPSFLLQDAYDPLSEIVHRHPQRSPV